jgi:LruC domain-containing protein
MKTKILSTVIASAFIFTGCISDLFDQAKNSSALIDGISSDFGWSTVSPVALNVQVNDLYEGQYEYTVKVYDKNPITESDARLLAEGFSKKGQSFQTTLSIPSDVTTLAILQIGPDSLKTLRIADVATSVSVDFSEQATSSSSIAQRSAIAYKASTAVSSDPEYATTIPSGAIAYSSNTWIQNGTYYLPDGFSGIVNVGSNVTFYVAGNVTVSSFYFGPSSKLFLLPGANANITFSGNALGQSACIVSVNSNATLSTSNLQVGSTVQVYNKGIFTTSGTLEIANSGNFYNEGTVTVGGQFSGQNGTSTILNYGTITAQSFLLAGNSSLTNAGTMTISGLTNINSTNAVFSHESGTYTTQNMSISGSNKNTYNACKLVVTETLALTDCKITMAAGASTSCANLTMNNTRIELGNKSLFTISTQASYQYNIGTDGFYGVGSEYALLLIKKAVSTSGGNTIIKYDGNLQVECGDHPDLIKDAWNIIYTVGSSVEWFTEGESTLSIDASTCSEGHTSASGSAPENPSYPVLVEPEITYTYAVEDLWPSYGDYDLNDLVLELVPSYYLNATNNVSTLILKATLRAVGAQKKLSAAIQLDNIVADVINGITYTSDATPLDGSVFVVETTGQETDQTQAVIPLFDNAHDFLGVGRTMTNTVIGGQTATESTETITIQFKESASIGIEDIDISKLNFFVVNDGNSTNRSEIHMRGYEASEKVNSELFNTGVDNSAVTPYSSDDNLVWILMLPTHFSYPSENSSILKAYPTFKSWAKSLGTEDIDWYSNPNSDYLYSN